MKLIIRTILWYLHFLSTFLTMYPKILKFEKQMDQDDSKELDKQVYEVTSAWAEKQLSWAGVEVVLTGEENLPEENVLFVSNHQSNFDIPVMMVYLKKPKGFIAKKSISNYPLINRYMKVMKCLFIDRTNIKEAGKVILNGIQILKNGHSLIIFPEGTRAKCSTVGEFKNGAFKLATKSKVKIVPISINGTYRAMEDHGIKISPATVRMHIHKPIDTTTLTKEEEANLPETLREQIKSKVDELNSL